MNPDVHSLDYIAVAHRDARVRQVAQILKDHSDDPLTLVERIIEWHDDTAFQRCGW